VTWRTKVEDSAASVCTGESETSSLSHRRAAINAYGAILSVFAIEMEYPERMLKMALIRETACKAYVRQ
jgi:hypothetical protein